MLLELLRAVWRALRAHPRATGSLAVAFALLAVVVRWRRRRRRARARESSGSLSRGGSAAALSAAEAASEADSEFLRFIAEAQQMPGSIEQSAYSKLISLMETIQLRPFQLLVSLNGGGASLPASTATASPTGTPASSVASSPLPFAPRLPANRGLYIVRRGRLGVFCDEGLAPPKEGSDASGGAARSGDAAAAAAAGAGAAAAGAAGLASSGISGASGGGLGVTSESARDTPPTVGAHDGDDVSSPSSAGAARRLRGGPRPATSQRLRVRAIRPGEVPLDELTRGETLTEFDLMGSSEGLPMSVVALEPTEVYFLSSAQYEQFCSLYPRDMVEVLQSAVARQWRIASFVLDAFLALPHSSARHDKLTQTPLNFNVMAAMEPLQLSERASARASPREAARPRRAVASARRGEEAAAAAAAAESESAPSEADEAAAEASERVRVARLLPRRDVREALGEEEVEEAEAAAEQELLTLARQRAHARRGSGPRAAAAAAANPAQAPSLRARQHSLVVSSSSEHFSPGEEAAAATALVAAQQQPVPALALSEAAAGPPQLLRLESAVDIPDDVAVVGKECALETGEVLYEEGAAAEAFFIVKRGRVTLSERDRRGVARDLYSVGRGCLLGGVAFFGATQHAESARAAEPCTLVAFSRSAFHALVKEAPRRVSVIADAVAQQLSPVLREYFDLGLHTSWYHAGQLIFSEGQDADTLFVIISGRVRAFAQKNRVSGDANLAFGASRTVYGQREFDSSGQFRVAFEAGRGELLGETSIFAAEARRPYTAVCVRDTQVVRISRAAFRHIVARHPSVLLRFARMMARRLTQHLRGHASERANISNITTVALVPVGTPLGDRRGVVESAYLTSFGESLANALGKHGGVTRLTSQSLDTAMGRGFASKLTRIFYAERASQWLTEQEENSRFLLLEVDPAAPAGGATPWTHFCLKHADCVLLVAHRSWHPEVTALEKELVWKTQENPVVRFLERQKELVILHPNSEPPAQTAQWLARRPVKNHHHVRLAAPADFARLARYLAGETVAVVLSGGGARGMAHVGALRALEEAGIPVDVIGGTSQGAMVAGLYAKHLQARALRAPCKGFANLFTMFNIIKSLTLPMLSYFHGQSFTDGIRTAVGDTRIEDLWIRYFCVTTNVSTHDLLVHDRGPLWFFLRASMSVLGMLPPVIDENNEMLIDGAYVNNLPVDVMHSWMQPAVIIAIDVEDRDNTSVQHVYDHGTSISGWYALYLKLVRRENVVSFADILMWLTFINHTRQLRSVVQKRLVDLYIHPPVTHFNLMDYSAFDTIERAGYEHTKQAIAEFLARTDSETRSRLTRKLLRRSSTADLALGRRVDPSAAAATDDCEARAIDTPLAETRTVRFPAEAKDPAATAAAAAAAPAAVAADAAPSSSATAPAAAAAVASPSSAAPHAPPKGVPPRGVARFRSAVRAVSKQISKDAPLKSPSRRRSHGWKAMREKLLGLGLRK